MDGAGLGEWQQCRMCVSGQQLGRVYYSLPLGFFPLSFSQTSLSQTTIAGVEEVVLASGVQGCKWRWMERASLELHVLSRDLPWRALEEQKGQQTIEQSQFVTKCLDLN